MIVADTEVCRSWCWILYRLWSL